MACILFYGPFNQRSRDTESLMIAFRKQGHTVICLTQQEGLLINDFLREHDVQAYAHVVPGARSGWWYYLRQLLYFIRFCWKHKVDVLYSHLEPANFVASIAQYFIKARTYLCRHHINEGELYKFNKDLYYRITYKLARHIIVVSNHAKKYMIKQEGILESKIVHINLAYDFSLYARPDQSAVSEIRHKFPAEILLLTISRLTEYKRPDVSIQLVKKLVASGVDVKLIILGKGEMEEALRQQIIDSELTNRVFLPGYVSNVPDYMAAADYLIHPSLLDSSCVAVKEAGLVNLPVIVCKGIGDFDDYIVHNHNGFVANPDKFVEESADIIKQTYQSKDQLETVGKNLRRSVFDLFSVDQVVHQYDSFNSLK